MTLLSTVRTTVLKIWISFTTPSCPWAEMKSPTLKGRNSMMTTPPAKFCKVPLNAMPTANPAEASKATSEDVFTPRMLMMKMIRMKFSTTETRFDKNLCSVGSPRRLMMPLAIHFLIHLMTQRPMTRTTRATTSLIPKGTIYSRTSWGTHSLAGVLRSIS